jgi:hypothetical protein
MMRSLQLPAIGTFHDADGRQRVMRAPHVATRLRRLLLRDCHDPKLEKVALPAHVRAAGAHATAKRRSIK